ncbi:MAG: DUF6475 domain-containing protein [Campylobacteraceae bacterium]|jgi:hypothetical protein|nr:DUF6475 domain-containing protein [Campylobacteraceae bacterium]
MTKEEFYPSFAGMAEVYNKPLYEILIETYYEVLKDFPFEDYKKACMEILSTRKYSNFPMPADFIEAMTGNADDMAMIALRELEHAIAKHGRYNSVCFEDKIIMACVDSMGGWITLCNTTSEEWKFERHNFLKLYKALSRNPERMRTPSRLVGLIEQQNGFAGYDISETPVIMIGQHTERIPLIEFKKRQEQLNLSQPKNRVLNLVKKVLA